MGGLVQGILWRRGGGLSLYGCDGLGFAFGLELS